MSELTQLIARRIIDRVGGSGQPPEYGIEYFSAGLDPYLDVIDAEYLSTLISQGGSTFKASTVVGRRTSSMPCVTARGSTTS
jgi:hypothetical protein